MMESGPWCERHISATETGPKKLISTTAKWCRSSSHCRALGTPRTSPSREGLDLQGAALQQHRGRAGGAAPGDPTDLPNTSSPKFSGREGQAQPIRPATGQMQSLGAAQGHIQSPCPQHHARTPAGHPPSRAAPRVGGLVACVSLCFSNMPKQTASLPSLSDVVELF